MPSSSSSFASRPTRGTCSVNTRWRSGSIACASSVSSITARTACAIGSCATRDSSDSSAAFIASTCCSISAATSASLFGKYWYSEPIEIPAASATALVVSPSNPRLTRTRAVAVNTLSTVARLRSWRGRLRGVVLTWRYIGGLRGRARERELSM